MAKGIIYVMSTVVDGLIKNGYPPQYSPEVFSKGMEQVENFKENE